MKKIFGLTFGGLQQKIFSLCIIVLLIVIGTYTAAAAYQAKHLGNTMEKANSDLHDTISGISEQTMQAVVNDTLVRNTDMEATIIDDMFSEVKANVLTLQTFATEIYLHADSIDPRKYTGPITNGDNLFELYHENGADPDSSEALEYATYLSDLMLAMYGNSEQIDSCFIGTEDGMFLITGQPDKLPDNELKTNFTAREREWYKKAVSTGEVCFTDIETDAFTGKQEVVCAAPVYVDGKLIAVVGANVFLDSISETVESSAENGGFLCIINQDGKVLFSPMEEGTFKVQETSSAPDLRESENRKLASFIEASLSEKTGIYTVTVDDTVYYMAGASLDSVGWTAISAVPEAIINIPTDEMIAQFDKIVDDTDKTTTETVNKSIRMVVIVTVLVILMAVSGSIALARKIVGPIRNMVKRMNELKDGDILFRMEECYRTGDEIEVLAESFASLSEKTVTYISEITRVTAEKERLGAELNVATQIQANMLPRIFPPYPDRYEFDIFASMKPAKEVGGDFYDFFLVDEDHLAVVMADVSGKGIPAALFMVIAKTLIKNRTQMGGTPAEILHDVNNQLCEGNEAEMFVTTWLAVIDLKTGLGTAANAGHEYPAFCRADGGFELIKRKHSPAVAMLNGIRFTQHDFKLNPGDTLFVYTDGVPEASDENNNMFGTERLINVLNNNKDNSLNSMLDNMKSEIERFVDGAPQFDDITMLALRFYGEEGKKN